MSFNKILIPIDGSAYSELAIEKGIELAKLAGSKITLFYVKDRSAYVQAMVGTNIDDVDKILQKEMEDILEDATEKLEKAGINFDKKATDGNPGREICSESREYDLIIMGTAGRTGIKKMIMGSVTQYAVTNAKCPVMAVKVME